jgi:hypothetical protein
MSLWYAVASSSGANVVTRTVGTNTGLTMAIGEYSYPPGSIVTCEHTENASLAESMGAFWLWKLTEIV